VVVKVVKVADVEALQKSGSIVHVKAVDEDNETMKIPSQTTSINVPHLGYSPGRDLYYMLTHNTQYLFFLCLINPRGLQDHWPVAMCQQLALTVWDQEEDLAVAMFQATCYHMRTTAPYQRIQFQ
jgi:hypothetical protein